MLCLHSAFFAFSISLAFGAYDIDRVYELQRGIQPFTIYNENYPSNYPIGKSCRYQFKAPSYFKVTALCSVNIGSNGYTCSPDDMFAYLEDGTTNLYSDQSMSGCGRFDEISIESRYNSIAFGVLSKQFSGNFSCEIRINSYPEPCDCGWHINTKIYNGSRPIQNGLASMAALYSENTQSVFCGGTLISENYCLTAAHCLVASLTSEIKKMWILVGRDNVTISDPNFDTHFAYNYQVEFLVVHENYDSQTNANDIGLVKTKQRMVWNHGVAPACLPNTADHYIGAAVTYAGWGFTQPDGQPSPVLLATSVTVCPIEYCIEDLDDNTITVKQTCTIGFGHDACQMDSGGPALFYDETIYRYIVYGIMSFGPLCGIEKPAVCTLVGAYLEWIKLNSRPMQSFCLTSN